MNVRQFRLPKTVLSKREREILKLTAMGKSLKECAIDMKITERTASCTKANMMEKLGIHKAVILTHYAIKKGIVPVLFSLVTLLARGQDVQFHYSVASLVVASAVDVHSSYGKWELNPVLGKGTFGPRQVMVKSVMLTTVVVGEYWFVRRWPRAEKPLRWLNYGLSGFTAGVAVRNYTL